MDLLEIARTYLRFLLIIFNVLFAFTGIIIVAVGISTKAYYNEFDLLLNDRYFYLSTLLITVGVVIFFIAFFGCCGAMKKNTCMTTTFSALLIAIFILEALVGIGGVLMKKKTENFLIQTLDETLHQYGQSNFNETTAIWDRIQGQFECCGVMNSSDWTNVTHGVLPISCCKIAPGTIGNFTCNVDHAFQHGCLEIFGNFVREHMTTIEGIGIGLAVIQLLGIIFSCYLSKAIRGDYETV